MTSYTVHYMGYYGYDVKVEAEDVNEARLKADEVFDNLSNKEFCVGAYFEHHTPDIWEND